MKHYLRLGVIIRRLIRDTMGFLELMAYCIFYRIRLCLNNIFQRIRIFVLRERAGLLNFDTLSIFDTKRLFINNLLVLGGKRM